MLGRIQDDPHTTIYPGLAQEPFHTRGVYSTNGNL